MKVKDLVDLINKSCENCRFRFIKYPSDCNSKYGAWEPIFKNKDAEKSCDSCKYGIDDDCKLYQLPCNNNDGWQPIESTEEKFSKLEFEKEFPQTGTTEQATHYQTADKQPIEIMQQLFTKEQMEGFLLGNVIKYAMRLNHKGQKLSDAGKCKQYAEWLCDVLHDKQIVPGGK